MTHASERAVDQSTAGKVKRVINSLASADGRSIRYYLKRLGMSDAAAYNMIYGYRIARSPIGYLRRQRDARSLVREVSPALRMSPSRGFAHVPAGTFPEVDPAIERVRQEFARRADRDRDRVGDPFRQVVVLPDELLKMPEVMALTLSSNLIAIAADYLGTLPVLQTVETWWSPAGQGLRSEEFKGSQFYHRDQTDFSLAKFVFNVIDIGPEGGPLTFLPRDVSDAVCRAIGDFHRRIPDEEIFEYCSKTEEVVCSGPAGTGHVADTARCLHYGGRTTGGERLVLMISYSTKFAPLEHVMRMDTSSAVNNGDRLSRTVLDLH